MAILRKSKDNNELYVVKRFRSRKYDRAFDMLIMPKGDKRKLSGVIHIGNIYFQKSMIGKHIRLCAEVYD